MTCQAFNIINTQIKTLRAAHLAQTIRDIAALRKTKTEIEAMLARDTAAASTARTNDAA